MSRGYFKTIDEMIKEVDRFDKLSQEEQEKETVAQIRRDAVRIKERERAEEGAARLRQEAVADVKARAEMFRSMIDKAHDDKDEIRYIYGVAALVIIKNLELGIEKMATDNIRSVIPDPVPAAIGLEDMDYLKRICPRFGGHSYIDIPLHEDVIIKNYTLCDLVGCAILKLRNPSKDVFDLFKDNMV